MITGHATVLLVRDVAASLAYYRDALGFEVRTWEGNPRHYGYASRDACAVHVACVEGASPRPNHEQFGPDMFDVYVYVDDVDALYEEIAGRGVELVHGVVEQGYGLREFRVRDPDGYILAFGTPVG